MWPQAKSSEDRWCRKKGQETREDRKIGVYKNQVVTNMPNPFPYSPSFFRLIFPSTLDCPTKHSKPPASWCVFCQPQ